MLCPATVILYLRLFAQSTLKNVQLKRLILNMSPLVFSSTYLLCGLA